MLAAAVRPPPQADWRNEDAAGTGWPSGWPIGGGFPGWSEGRRGGPGVGQLTDGSQLQSAVDTSGTSKLVCQITGDICKCHTRPQYGSLHNSKLRTNKSIQKSQVRHSVLRPQSSLTSFCRRKCPSADQCSCRPQNAYGFICPKTNQQTNTAAPKDIRESFFPRTQLIYVDDLK